MMNNSLPLVGLFIAFFSLGFSQIISRASLWYVFTPSYTYEEGMWMEIPDYLRIILAIFLLIIIPTIIFAESLFFISKYTFLYKLHGALSDIFIIPTAFVVPSVHLGLYNIWQSIIRRFPKYFYSPSSIKNIEKIYPSAFSKGIRITAILGILYIFISILYFFFLFFLLSM